MNDCDILCCDARPTANSITMIGIARISRKKIYSNTKAAPPYFPVMNGKRHTLPSPIAQPADKNMNPKRLAKVSRGLSDMRNITSKLNFQCIIAVRELMSACINESLRNHEDFCVIVRVIRICLIGSALEFRVFVIAEEFMFTCFMCLNE